MKTTTLLRIVAFTLATVALLLLGVTLLREGLRRYYSAVYPMKHRELVEAAGEEFGIAPSLIFAIIHTESSFEEGAISHAKAKGLMQLTDDTFQWALTRAGDKDKYTPEDLYTPEVNIHYGVYVLKLLGEQFEHTDTILAAYNAGQGKVQDWLNNPAHSADGIRLDTIPYEETAAYIRRVNHARARYQQLYDVD